MDDMVRAQRCFEALRDGGVLVVLTGAGISAEVGIPTFRGEEGYWTRGSKVYQPMELATRAAFESEPATVWSWYLYRRGVCSAAAPGRGHEAVARMAAALGDRFHLVTQNVDGLHPRTGIDPARIYEIHGNIFRARCSRDCSAATYSIPDRFDDWPKDAEVTDEDLDALRCPACGAPGRPHVLWFDECYDEARYRADSALSAAAGADVLLVVGTSGATNLPMQMGALSAVRNIPIWDVNPEDNPFGDFARRTPGGVLRTGAGEALVTLADALAAA